MPDLVALLSSFQCLGTGNPFTRRKGPVLDAFMKREGQLRREVRATDINQLGLRGKQGDRQLTDVIRFPYQLFHRHHG